MKGDAMVWLVKVIPRTHKMKGNSQKLYCNLHVCHGTGTPHPPHSHK